jgi:hypothetical protein
MTITMRLIISVFISIVVLILTIHCTSHSSGYNYTLSVFEKRFCDSLHIDTTVILDIRKLNSNKIEPFHYSLSKAYENGKWIESESIKLIGLVFSEQNSKSYEMVFSLKDEFKKKGYSIFLLENNFNINNQLDNIGVLKTTDKFDILKQINTDGIN